MLPSSMVTSRSHMSTLSARVQHAVIVFALNVLRVHMRVSRVPLDHWAHRQPVMMIRPTVSRTSARVDATSIASVDWYSINVCLKLEEFLFFDFWYMYLYGYSVEQSLNVLLDCFSFFLCICHFGVLFPIHSRSVSWKLNGRIYSNIFHWTSMRVRCAKVYFSIQIISDDDKHRCFFLATRNKLS